MSLLCLLLLSLFFIIPNKAIIKDCSSCTWQEIWCPPNEDCNINCYDPSGCSNSIIYCPKTRHKCNVQCITNSGQRNCEYLLINAFIKGSGASTELIVNASGHNDIFQYGLVLCPPFNSECNIYCDSTTSCRGVKINASTSINTNISIIARADSALLSAEIYGAAFGSIDIYCNGYQSCFQTLIESHPDSLLLDINATGSQILERSTIYCPNNGANKDILCKLQIAGASAIKMVRIYAAEAFYDIDIICDDSYHEGCLDAELFCDAPTYSDSCSLQQNGDTFECISNTAKCQTFSYLPTEQPTTTTPTTMQPTTAKPTTSNPTIYPTTYSLITAIPTTVNPTIYPTTYNPTTSIPTTSIPSISNPTDSPSVNITGLYGVNIRISFEYDVGGNISDVLLDEIFKNITDELIETEINEIEKECIRKKDYNIDIDKIEKIVIINAMIYVCNKKTENILSVHSQNDLETDLIDIIDDNAILIVKNPDIWIEISTIKTDGEIISTLIALNTSSDLNKNINAENDGSDEFVIIIAVFGCIIFICILVIIFVCIHNVKKDKNKISGIDTGRDRVCTNSVAASYKIGEPANIAKPPQIEMEKPMDKKIEYIQEDASTPLTADGTNDIEADIVIIYDDHHKTDVGGNANTVFSFKQTLGEQSEDDDEIKNEEDGILVKQWLIQFDLERYYHHFIENGYESLEFIKEIKEKESLIDIGICTEIDIIKLIEEINILNGNNYDNTTKGMDLENYKNWNIDDIIIWIKSLENARYHKYIDILINGFKITKISGNDLPDLQQNDLTNHPFNINNKKDKKDLIQHFKSLSKTSD